MYFIFHCSEEETDRACCPPLLRATHEGYTIKLHANYTCYCILSQPRCNPVFIPNSRIFSWLLLSCTSFIYFWDFQVVVGFRLRASKFYRLKTVVEMFFSVVITCLLLVLKESLCPVWYTAMGTGESVTGEFSFYSRFYSCSCWHFRLKWMLTFITIEKKTLITLHLICGNGIGSNGQDWSLNGISFC